MSVGNLLQVASSSSPTSGSTSASITSIESSVNSFFLSLLTSTAHMLSTTIVKASPSGMPTDRYDLMRLIEDEDAQSRSYLNQ